MTKLKENRGFSVAELLILVAILGTLIAKNTPVFAAQLRKTRLATNQANTRSAYAAVIAQINLDGVHKDTTYVYDVDSSSLTEELTYQISNCALSTSKYPIEEWNVDLEPAGIKLGDKVAKQWRVYIVNSSIGSDTIVGYTPIWDK